MSERADVVVIGAGMGGLAAAVTLAGAGLSVVVLEAGSGPGGYATGFRSGPYRFDTALHALNGCAPGGGVDEMYRALGIDDRLHLQRLDPLYLTRTPGGDLVAHADLFRWERELIDHFPTHHAGVRTYLDEALAVYRDSRRWQEDMLAGAEPSITEFATRYPALLRVSGETWEQMLRRHVDDAGARAALAGLWAYAGLPPSQLAALTGATLVSYYEHGGWYPLGGASALTAALIESLHARGGEVRFGQRVTRLDTDDAHVTTVSTVDGHQWQAGIVVSNASAPGTVQLIAPDRLPPDYVARIRRPVPSYTTFSVYLGLRRDVFAEHGLPHEVFAAPGSDVDAMYEAALRGDWSNAGIVISDYTRVDPGCAPPGHGTVVVTSIAGWDHADTWGTGGRLVDYGVNPQYRRIKREVTDALVACADRAIPGLADAIEVREASSPLTNHRYTGNPQGAIEGFENTVANSGPGWLPNRTPLGNLFLAGAWTCSGGMNPSMASGVAAARSALRHAMPAHGHR